MIEDIRPSMPLAQMHGEDYPYHKYGVRCIEAASQMVEQSFALYGRVMPPEIEQVAALAALAQACFAADESVHRG